MEHKSIEIKELSDEGQVKALISTFGRDRDGDVMTRDAFTKSDGKSIPMVWSHNWDQPVGKGTVKIEPKGATFTGQFNLATSAGREAYESVKFAGDLQEYSIGFLVKDADFSYQDIEGEKVYTRTIKDIELFEASPVLVGAAYNTGTISVKSAKGQEDIHEQIKALKEQHDEGCELGDECPFKEVTPEAEPVIEHRSTSRSEREKALAEIEAALGYRPLIAEGA